LTPIELGGKDYPPLESACRKIKQMKKNTVAFIVAAAFMTAILACSQPLSKREQAAVVGGTIGVTGGAIIGSVSGRAATGALIGGPIGLLAGALIGDQFMAQDQKLEMQQRQIQQNRAEIERLRRESARLERENERLTRRN
jgi:hypothetical protein